LEYIDICICIWRNEFGKVRNGPTCVQPIQVAQPLPTSFPFSLPSLYVRSHMPFTFCSPSPSPSYRRSHSSGPSTSSQCPVRRYYKAAVYRLFGRRLGPWECCRPTYPSPAHCQHGGARVIDAGVKSGHERKQYFSFVELPGVVGRVGRCVCWWPCRPGHVGLRECIV
jgi:hypothetical protein